MARMPDAVWLGEHADTDDLMDRYDVVCVHTIVGFYPAHAAHFSVRWDGLIGQSRDTRFRSAANLNGNHRVIAIENEDHGPAFGGTPSLPGWVPLTDAQVEANAAILRWAHEEHGVPLQLCPDSRPTSRGLAYHRQGIDGNFDGFRFPGRVDGGELWSKHFGKVCPTDVRIAQLPTILRIAQGDDMPLTAADAKVLVDALLNTEVEPDLTVRRALRRAARTDAEVKSLVAAALGAVDIDGQVQAAVAAAMADAVIEVNVNVGTKEATS